MENAAGAQIVEIIKNNQEALVDDLLASMKKKVIRLDKSAEKEIILQATQLLGFLEIAIPKGHLSDLENNVWDETRQLLSDFSQTRARQGFSPIETATFIFSFKEPLFTLLRNSRYQFPF